MSGFEGLHAELRSVARKVLAGDGAVTEAELASLGWFGLEVPEWAGGSGATFAEAAVVAEELARGAAAVPYLGRALLGVATLVMLEPSELRDELLRSVACGTTRIAVCMGTGDDAACGTPPPYVAELVGRTARINGRAEFVPDAPGADLLLLVARAGHGGDVVAVVAPDHAGVIVAEQRLLDETRRFGAVVAEGVVVPSDRLLRFAAADLDPLVALADRAATACAVDSLGLAEATLEATTAYVSARRQFGRPVGSFQAVKHACADMAIQVAVARALVNEAVARVATGGADTNVAASRAKAFATSIGVEVVGKAVQLHGGFGYTWESGLHAYLKRAALNRSLFGSPAAHRRRLARLLLGGSRQG